MNKLHKLRVGDTRYRGTHLTMREPDGGYAPAKNRFSRPGLLPAQEGDQ